MNREDIKNLLSRLRVQPSKDFGQSFLADFGLIQDIVDFGRIGPSDVIVEIGPGLAALTRELASITKDLTVIEIEPAFANLIREDFPKVKVIEADVRTVDFSELGESLLVFGNLPYVFSTDILFHLLAYSSVVKRAVLMFQKEYAERLYAQEGSKKYGSLTLQLANYARVRPGPIISGESFFPVVAVESQVVEVEFYSKPRLEGEKLFNFQRLVSAAFFKRRKKLLNSLKASKAFTAEQLESLENSPEFRPEARAEDLSFEEYACLAGKLS